MIRCHSTHLHRQNQTRSSNTTSAMWIGLFSSRTSNSQSMNACSDSMELQRFAAELHRGGREAQEKASGE